MSIVANVNPSVALDVNRRLKEGNLIPWITVQMICIASRIHARVADTSSSAIVQDGMN